MEALGKAASKNRMNRVAATHIPGGQGGWVVETSYNTVAAGHSL